MKLLIVSLPSVSMVHGGPRTQILETTKHFPSERVQVEFFDSWKAYNLSRFDLVHLFSAGLPTYEIAVRMNQFGIPMVVSPIFYTNHSALFVRAVRIGEKLANRFGRGVWTDYGLTERICRSSRLCLPNTNAEARLLERGLGISSRSIQVIPNGVNERFAKADPQLFIKTYGVKDFILNVGHVGSPRKNVFSLIRAVRSIDRPCVIVGQIHHNAYAEQCLKEASGNTNIRIIEGLPNDSDMLASAYAACDTFVLPSYYETPGIAALEAGLAGAKIVVTPHGGPREYFGDHAVYVDPTSVNSIRDGILKGLAKTKSTALADRIRKEFLWPRISEKTLESYNKVVSTPR